jgi:hypothetical protein
LLDAIGADVGDDGFQRQVIAVDIGDRSKTRDLGAPISVACR